MIILQSIRVRNFRAIKEATFQPLEEGITGIFGPNGAGKTSFLAATLFALYGVRPPGANQSSLRRIGSGKEESSVSVVFTHLNQQVEIIRELKAPNNRVVVNIYVDGVPQTVTSVTAADQWVKTRLGIDANGFLTAFVVRQKELDQLVQAKPSERKQIIEKLAGIDAINIALKNAREEENSVKKTLNGMPGSENETLTAAQVLEAAGNRVSELSKEIAELEEKIVPLEKQISDVREKTKLVAENNEKIMNLITKKETLEPSLLETENELKNLPEIFVDEKTIEELREEFTSLKNTLLEKTNLLNNLTAEKISVEKTLEEEKTELSNIKAKIVKLEKLFQPDINYGEKILETSDKIKTLEGENASLSTKIKDTEENLSTLEHSTTCPTCLQNLNDPDQLINLLKTIISESEQKKTDNIDELNMLNKTYDTIVEEYSNYQEYSRLVETVKTVETKIKTMNIDSIVEQLKTVQEEIMTLEKTKDDVEERGKKLKESETTKNSQTVLQTKISNLKETLNSITEEIEKLTATVGGVEEFQKIKNLTKIEEEYAHIKNIKQDKTTQLAVAKQKYSTEKTNYDNVKNMWEKKKQLLQKQETMTWTTDMLNKFRTETISSLAPELSETATGLISEMTNGDFTEIRLDEEFNAYLTDSNGIERPSTWLSGGEESAVALALRIAIAFLITGNNPSLLWLDEVLTAQDADRRSTMLTMIRQLPIQQIVMINHTQEAADIVDKTVEIIPNIVEGSTIKETEQVFADII